jgi:hypothetical protein
MAPTSSMADDGHGHARPPKTRFEARLRGGNEVPVCSSTGTGKATLTIDDTAQTIDFEVSFDLNGVVTVSHTHVGQPFVAGGVSFFFCGGGGKPACPASPATITGTVVPADIVGPTGQGIAPGEFAEVLAAIRAGNAYANVHSDICPGGEIRGQFH